MTRWNAVEPTVPPPPDLRARLRRVWRATAAAVLTAGCLGLYLGLRAGDAGLRPLGLGAPRAAPRVLRLWARGALPLLGLRLERRGRPVDPPGARVANHASWLDIVTLLHDAPVAFVSKSEVADWPVIGAIGRAIGTVFIDRRATEARRHSDLLGTHLARGAPLCLFAEGTSTDGRRVLPFKSTLFSIFAADGPARGVRVQPVSIRYHPGPGLPEDFYGWWGDMDFAGHLTDVLARSRGGVVRVTYHPPLCAADFADRKALALACGAVVRAGFEADAPADAAAQASERA